jgi:hypothetical protein
MSVQNNSLLNEADSSEAVSVDTPADSKPAKGRPAKIVFKLPGQSESASSGPLKLKLIMPERKRERSPSEQREFNEYGRMSLPGVHEHARPAKVKEQRLSMRQPHSRPRHGLTGGKNLQTS